MKVGKKGIMILVVFILYASFIFLIDTNILLLVVFLLNLLAMLCLKIKLTDAIENIVKLLPFILLTVIINCLLSNYEYAILVAVKLILVCNATYIYSKTTTISEIARMIKKLCMPLKLLKVNPDDMELLVCISLSMIPILKREYSQLREACFAKGMDFNVKNMKVILTKLMISVMKRVNEIEESMIEKGYEEV